jgi:hypothetical protein
MLYEPSLRHHGSRWNAFGAGNNFTLCSSYLILIRVDNGSGINMNIYVTWKNKVIVSTYYHLNLFDYCSLQFSLAFMGSDLFFCPHSTFFLSSQKSSHSTSQESLFQAWHTLICVFKGSLGTIFWFMKFHSLIFLVHLCSIAHHICQLNM